MVKKRLVKVQIFAGILLMIGTLNNCKRVSKIEIVPTVVDSTFIDTLNVSKIESPLVAKNNNKKIIPKRRRKANDSIISPILSKASYYADAFHGRLTASGETFDMHDMTAAHKTLPFGTMVKVKNLNNGKEIVVKINDRGPFIEGREIDLSLKAAKKLNMIESGVIPVEIEII